MSAVWKKKIILAPFGEKKQGVFCFEKVKLWDVLISAFERKQTGSSMSCRS